MTAKARLIVQDIPLSCDSFALLDNEWPALKTSLICVHAQGQFSVEVAKDLLWQWSAEAEAVT